MKQGRQEGQQEGGASLLLRQLARKFGLLPDEVRQRVSSADPETLLVWGERVLTAERVEEVFGDAGSTAPSSGAP